MTTEIKEVFATSDLYQFLSLGLRLPTKEWTTAWKDGRLAEDVLNVLGELDFMAEDNALVQVIQEGMKSRESADDLYTAMKREYTRLFCHPQKPMIDIYETLFLYQPEGGNENKPVLFISQEALDVKRCYNKAGLVMDKKVNEPADHMATEMEFMMYLYRRLGIALQNNDQQETAKRKAEIKEFKVIHLRKWARAFFRNCIELSERGEYQILGKIGTLFMEKTLAINSN